MWVFAVAADLDARLVLMAVLVTLWGIRLTFNYARKGGYRPGGEDYRWAVLRGRMSPVQFQVFNLLFISIYQNALILLFCLPAYTAFEAVGTPLGVWDVLLALAFLAFLVGETVADQQQWTFHRWKAAERAAGRTPEPGFLQTGPVPDVATPELLLRAGAVVGVLRLRDRRNGRVAALDDRGRGAAHAPLHRVDDLHRVDLAREVSRVRRLPGSYLGDRAVVSAGAEGSFGRAHRLIRVRRVVRVAP